MVNSAQEFVRALKAPSDPPETNGPLKIQIAADVWRDSGFHIPNKEEVIVDWILTRLLKDKDKKHDLNPIHDKRYWDVLHSVLIASTEAVKTARVMKTWLIPLLNRTPIAPIIIAYLTLLSEEQNYAADQQLGGSAAHALCILWPMAVPRFSADTSLDCFGAVLRVLRRPQIALDEHLTRLATLIVAAYSSAVANTGSRKKLFAVFAQNHVLPWLECVAQVTSEESTMQEQIFQAGAETIFNVDILRVESDRNFIDKNLSSLIPDHPAAVLSSLSRLFAAYAESVRKHRGTLFSQGSHQGPGVSLQLSRRAAMKFYASCEATLDMCTDSDMVWQVRLALLRVVRDQALYIIHDDEVEATLRASGDKAFRTLKSAMLDGTAARADPPFMVLTAIAQIDYDMLSEGVRETLPGLLMWGSAPASTYPFLDEVLEYHRKTRSMDEAVEHLLQACMDAGARNALNYTRPGYAAMATSPFMAHAYLEKFSNALHGFLTPGQVPELVEHVLSHLTSAVDSFYGSESKTVADGGEGARKKRKGLKSGSVSALADSEDVACRVDVLSRLASVVLTSCPLQTLQDAVQSEVLQTIHASYTSLLAVLSKGLKRLRHEGRADTWSWEVVLVAVLRLQYQLSSVPRLHIPIEHDEKTLTRMAELPQVETLLPELRVAMCQTLCAAVSRGWAGSASVFDGLLAIIEHQREDVYWAGHMHDLQEDALPVACFHLLMERWLALFDSLASNDVLNRLATILVRIRPRAIDMKEQGLSIPAIWLRILHDASFWELPRMRDAILASVGQWSSAPAASAGDTGAGAVYQLLTRMPMDYLTRSTRAELLRKALLIDSSGTPSNDTPVVVRNFLLRMFLHTGAAEHTSAMTYLIHLMNSSTLHPDGKRFVSVTTSLIEMHILSLLRAATRQDAGDMQKLVEWFVRSPVLNTTEGQEPSADLHLDGLLAFVDTLTSGFAPDQFPATLMTACVDLQERMAVVSYAQMSTLVGSKKVLDVAPAKLLLRSLKLRRWLKVESKDSRLFGAILAAKIQTTHRDANLSDPEPCIVALSLAQEELTLTDEKTRTSQLGITVAIYVSFANAEDAIARDGMDTQMTRFSRSLSLPDYSAILEFVWEGLRDNHLDRTQLATLAHLSSLLMHDAPEGSMKVVQAHFTRCLVQLADQPAFYDDSQLQLAGLHLVSKYLNDRPASVRQQDLSSLWSLLGSCLAGCDHHRTTSQQVFQELVAVVNALIRLRRDLVVSMLPHLSAILRRFILCLKHPQPHLGVKQSRIVTDSLPQWISSEAPLTSEEGKAVARLLTTLTTKTTVRTYSNADTQKAKSLARPFSKHAAYVLAAYTEAMNDPLSYLPADVRRELQPGLFALCEIMGEQNRDALMISLADGGKTVLKGLWREYEKERYTGKG